MTKLGIDEMTSITRCMKRSIFPPKKPDTRPYVTPIIKSIKVATMAIKREIRIPTITRFAKLRPRLSVPKINLSSFGTD